MAKTTKKRTQRSKKHATRKTTSTRAKKTRSEKKGTKASVAERRKRQTKTGRKPRRNERMAKSFAEFSRHVKKDQKRLDRENEVASKVLDKHESKLMRRAGVVGVDVGFRMKKDRFVIPPRYVIRIDVEYKMTDAELKSSRRKRIPQKIDGIDVKVLERRYVATAGGLPPGCNDVEWRCRREPIVGGVAISRNEAGLRAKWGTLGCIVFKDGEAVYLMNAHVAAAGGPLETGKPIRQPPMKAVDDPIIGTILGEPVLSDRVDCALVKPIGRSPKQHILGLKSDANYATRKLKTRDQGITKVLKVGAKTGFAPVLGGIIENVRKKVSVKGLGVFKGQILIRGERALFQDGGDSGAVIVEETKIAGKTVYNIVGLCFAATDDGLTAIACHFHRVAKSLDITVNSE